MKKTFRIKSYFGKVPNKKEKFFERAINTFYHTVMPLMMMYIAITVDILILRIIMILMILAVIILKPTFKVET